jgi:hypothetical protein
MPTLDPTRQTCFSSLTGQHVLVSVAILLVRLVWRGLGGVRGNFRLCHLFQETIKFTLIILRECV